MIYIQPFYPVGTFVQLHEKLSRAVKAYDKLLEDRISSSSYRANDERESNSNANYSKGYASYNGSYINAPQQYQGASIPKIQNYSAYNAPQTSPFPQTPVSQQSYIYPQNHIQQQQLQQIPVIQHQQIAQQTPVVQHQPYAPVTLPLAPASISSNNITSSNHHQYGQHQYQQIQQTPTSHTPLAPSTTDAYQQKVPGMNNQLYNYPSVPTAIPSHNTSHYYSSSDAQHTHYDNSIQQSNGSKHQSVEEAPLIEL